MNKKIRKLLSFIVPLSLKQKFRDLEKIKHLNKGFAQLVYSQQGEDLELSRLFPGSFKGFYVDIGAFHPFIYSNTFKLYERGWRGINIEPNPENVRLLKKYRPEDINLNIGVSGQTAKLKYYSFNGGAVNTFDERHARKWSSLQGSSTAITKEILTEPLSQILEKHLPIKKQIDVMNIDVEGMDLEVLISNDWTKFRPHIILVEDLWQEKTSVKESEIYQFLYSNNYSLLNIVGITLFFKDNAIDSFA